MISNMYGMFKVQVALAIDGVVQQLEAHPHVELIVQITLVPGFIWQHL